VGGVEGVGGVGGVGVARTVHRPAARPHTHRCQRVGLRACRLPLPLPPPLPLPLPPNPNPNPNSSTDPNPNPNPNPSPTLINPTPTPNQVYEHAVDPHLSVLAFQRELSSQFLEGTHALSNGHPNPTRNPNP
jgi:hypothetical protein